MWWPQNSHVFTKLLCHYFICHFSSSLLVHWIFSHSSGLIAVATCNAPFLGGNSITTRRFDSFSNMATKSSLLISHQSIRTLILNVLFFRCRPNSFSCHFEVFCVLLLRLRKAFTLDGLKTSSSALLCLDSLSCSTVYLCYCSFAFLSF